MQGRLECGSPRLQTPNCNSLLILNELLFSFFRGGNSWHDKLFLRNVFVSCGCCNKWPINLVVWNNRNLLSYSSWDQKSKISLLKLKSRFQQGYKPSGDLKESTPHLFQHLVTAGILWPRHSSVCLHLSHGLFLNVSLVSLCCLPVKICVMALSTHLDDAG